MINVAEYILSKFNGQFNARGNLHANCPFHDDHTKSFSINNKGVFICGSTKCGIRGNFPYFYKLIEGLTWHQVKEDLDTFVPQDNLGLASLLPGDNKNSAEYKINPWPPHTEEICHLDYFEQRGFSDNDVATLCQKYGLRYGVSGYHEELYISGSIVVPIYDVDGTYRTFQVRYLSDKAKSRWQNPMNSPLQDILYAGWCVSGTQKHVWVVEGASDVWNLSRFGYEAVGLFTKEATYGQMDSLYNLHKQLGVSYIVCLDGDAHSKQSGYGKDYCLKLNNEILAFGIPSSIIYLDKDEDPGSISLQRASELYNSTMGV